MQCYYCGSEIPAGLQVCPSCQHGRSRMIYRRLWGVIGGIAGSLLGFTFADVAGALIGGLLGIVILEIIGTFVLRPKET